MDNFIELTFDEWCEQYKPIKNHIDTNASFDGEMFETYGDEVAFVKEQDPAYIWMYGDGDDGGMYIWSGEIACGGENYGAYVTEIGYTGKTVIEIEFFETLFETSFVKNPSCNA